MIMDPRYEYIRTQMIAEMTMYNQKRKNEEIEKLKEDIAILTQKLEKLEKSKDQTLYDVCLDWCDDFEDPPVSELINRIEQWLPELQSSVGSLDYSESSQNHYTEAYSLGWNECLDKIKKNLR